MTPYALLTVKPSDGDDVIRARFHVLVRHEHADVNNGVPGTMWFVLSEAYNSIKTEDKRATFERLSKQLSNWCRKCGATGVGGSRFTKVFACPECKGTGRLT